ncbi:HutD family protein [Kangiella sp.]|uniref:HutD/Ves family protein n=1 Tax=Kangiella sp. TaxID=1920245 RepID=UPI003A9166ED
MFTIIPPQRFKQIPWKNGKGMTTELAISEGGDVNDFDWRLSIAGVAEDGIFSNFTGIQRYLFLLTGNGLKLRHQFGSEFDNKENISSHCLLEPLDLATFDGGLLTDAALIDGPITDFNLMVKQGAFEVKTQVLKDNGLIEDFPLADVNFVYAVNGDCQVSGLEQEITQEKISLQSGHLLIIEPKVSLSTKPSIDVDGKQAIVVALKKVCTNPAEE